MAISLPQGYLHIRDLVVQTEMRREQLYMWERRYHFPSPERDAFGDRIYAPDQVEKLLIIRQLLKQGLRAGKVVPLDLPTLRSLWHSHAAEVDQIAPRLENVVSKLAEHQIDAMRELLSKELMRDGLREFLLHVMTPLRDAIHDRVVRGQLHLYQEQCFAEVVRSMLAETLRLIRPNQNAPVVLLSSPPSDPNGFGVAITEAFLTTQGIRSMIIGSGLPVLEIAAAQRAYKANAVCLCMDNRINSKGIAKEILVLRNNLDEATPLWVVGRTVNLIAKPIGNVKLAQNLSKLARAIVESKLNEPLS